MAKVVIEINDSDEGFDFSVSPYMTQEEETKPATQALLVGMAIKSMIENGSVNSYINEVMIPIMNNSAESENNEDSNTA